MRPFTILLVEDTEKIRTTNAKALRLRGYDVLEAGTLGEARALFGGGTPDLVILDIMLPDGSGLDFCRELRKTHDVPVLFLTALGTEWDMLNGYGAGGEDYLVKPYGLKILIAKTEVLLRRSVRGRLEIDFTDDMLRADFVSRRAYWAGEDLRLKTKEFSLLEILIRNRGRFMDARELYELAWGMDSAGDARTVRVHISRIRQKIRERGGSADIISERGKGYMFKSNAQWTPGAE